MDTHSTDTSPEASATRRTLRKGSKLRHRSLVEGVFSQGSRAYAFPLRAIWRSMSSEQLEGNFRGYVPKAIGKVQMLITVPKKKRRHAVDRVLLRRRIREAFRLNCGQLREAVDASGVRTLGIAFVYVHDGNTDYSLIERRMRKLLTRITESLQHPDPAADGNDDTPYV